jgi:hypothetical protein
MEKQQLFSWHVVALLLKEPLLLLLQKDLIFLLSSLLHCRWFESQISEIYSSESLFIFRLTLFLYVEEHCYRESLVS